MVSSKDKNRAAETLRNMENKFNEKKDEKIR
jgi:hypothetical protein